MARILAIETSTKICSVALIEGDEILGEISLSVPQVHVERLVVMVNNLLEDLHLTCGGLDAVAVSNGPGSFTGLRIGLSVAKGIVFALDKKLIAIPTLDAIAFGICGFDKGKTIVPILHARAEEFYYASFKLEGKRLTLMRNYTAANAEDIAAEFSGGNRNGTADDTIFVGEGVQEFSEYEIVKRCFDERAMKSLPVSARNVAFLASERFDRNDFADLRSLVPLYVKEFVAIKKKSYSNLSPLKSGA